MNQTSFNRPGLARRGLPPSATPLVFAFYMAAIMAALMCCVIVGVGRGLSAELPGQIWHAYRLAMPVAFVCVLAVRPLVLRLVRWTVRSE